MNMVEKVAKAVEQAVRDCERSSKMWEDAARAAIEAMREPTEAVLQAGQDAAGEEVRRVPFTERRIYLATPTWEAMIDAALADPS